jgi:hypothetical protein
MKLKIFTSVTNQPAFAELQAQTFEKFLDCDYEFHLIDDSIDHQNLSDEYIKICKENSIIYHRKPERLIPHNPMMGCAFAVQWTYQNLIKQYNEDIILFVDSDMFLFQKFNPIEYMQDKIITGCIQIRGKIEYIWNGIFILNMPKIASLNGDLNFNCGFVEGELTDVGGHTYYFLKENELIIDDIQPSYGGFYNDIELENMETFMGGKFLHFRGGTLWDGKVDVYERKLKYLNNILKTV